MELLSSVLDNAPDLSSNRRGALGTNERVDTGRKAGEGILYVGALCVAGTQESSIQGDEDPRSALEENSGQEDAEPEEGLKGGDDGHGSVIVLLDKGANLISERAVDSRLAIRGGGTVGLGGRLGSHDCRNQVGAGVGSDVKDGVDRVRQESERILRRKEPDQGHGEILNILISEKAKITTGGTDVCLCASALGLVNNDAIGESGGKERNSVAELSHASVVVHSQPREAVPESREDERQVASEPSELQGLGESQQPLLKRQIRVRCGRHRGGQKTETAKLLRRR